MKFKVCLTFKCSNHYISNRRKFKGFLSQLKGIVGKIFAFSRQSILLESGDTGAQSIQSARLSIQSSELAPHSHSPASQCLPPLLVPFGRGTHSLAGEGAGGANSGEGTDTLWYTRYIGSIIPLYALESQEILWFRYITV